MHFGVRRALMKPDERGKERKRAWDAGVQGFVDAAEGEVEEVLDSVCFARYLELGIRIGRT